METELDIRSLCIRHQGPLLRILIAGDSAAAGVGVATQAEALAGRLARHLSPHCTVQWRLIAVNGLESPGLLALLEATPADRFDVVVLSIGVNDVTGLRAPSKWLQWQDRLALVIERRFRPGLLIHCAVPPMHRFSALPQPLRAMHSPFQGSVAGGLACDGFHPGVVAYNLWAEGLVKRILATPMAASEASSRVTPVSSAA